MKAITYLHFDGNCKEAMTFYAAVLGGKITVLLQFKDAPEEMCKTFPKSIMNLTMHCTMEAGNMAIAASDYFNEKEKLKKGNDFAISLNFDEEAKAVKVYNDLVEEGTVIMPLENAFWGGKFGMLQDKFGTRWMLTLNTETHSS